MFFILLLIWIVGLCLGAPIAGMTLATLGLGFLGFIVFAMGQN